MSRDLAVPELWALVRPFTGEAVRVQPTARGFSSDVSAVVTCEKGPFFVKAIRNRPGGRRDSIIRERLINPYVCPVSPALRWDAEDDEWIVLGFEAVEGRSSGFEPDSPDLPEVVDVLNRIGKLGLPEVAQGWPETRWDRFAVDEADAALFQGEALLHTDINPSNVMIGDQDNWAVDWAWPTRGAAFIDAACLVVQLVAAGHSAESAESWVAGCTAWAGADPTAVDAFAAATLRMHRTFADRHPEASWLTAMAEAARSWADHRGVPTT
jgi:hypothetical protein